MPTATDDAVAVDRFGPDDRDGVRALYETVFDRPATAEWFAWKYEDNPYTDAVPVAVARADGRVVGALPFFVLRMRAGERELTGRVPSDLMVHPEYRRQGIFSRLSRVTADWYRGDRDTVLFGFPNDVALPGWLESGYERVGTTHRHHRVQRPGTFVRSRTDLPGAGAAGRLLTAVTRGYLAARDRLGPAHDHLSVTRYDEVPGDVFASLYRAHVPAALHTVRDETFYDWRFDNPRWEYTAYVVAGRHGPVAGAVAGRQTHGGYTTVRATDVVPLGGGSTSAWQTLLDRVVAANRDAHVVSAPSGPLPGRALSALGFRRDDDRLLDRLTSDTPLIVRTPPGVDATAAGVDVLDGRNWLLSFSDHDTA